MKKQILIALLFFATRASLQSQIAGSFTVPGSFPSMAAAINTLNLTGVAGAVTINVAANYTETVPTGGLKLINPPGSGTTTVLFRKLGTGANPILYAYTGGTATIGSNLRDGIWMFVDCMNMTVDGIDLFDPNATNPATMEFGYAFYKGPAANGNRNNTIQNCVITLGSQNNVLSRGIDVSYSYYSSNTTPSPPNSSLQTNSFNTFHSNVISKCDVGINITGVYLSNIYDQSNDVGGLSAVTGNTIVNYGCSGVAAGIYADHQSQFNASFNVINNNNGLGISSAGGIQGIYASTGSDGTINSNTISLSCSNSPNLAPLGGILQAGVTGTVNINNNIFPNLSYTSTSGPFSNSVICASSNNFVNINNNQVGSYTATNGTVNIITVKGGTNAIVSNNSISGATIAANGMITGISVSSSQQQQINNNVLGNFVASGSSTVTQVTGIVTSAGGWTLSASNNTIANMYGCNLMGMSFTTTLSTASYSVTGNQVTNLGVSVSNTMGPSSFGIIVDMPATSGTMAIRSNTISNIVGQNGSVSGIVADGKEVFLSQNKICDLSAGQLTGIEVSAAQSYIYNNLVGGLQASSNYPLNLPLNALIMNQGSSQVYFNTFCLTNTATPTGNFSSHVISAGNSPDLRNNIFVNTSVTTGTGVAVILNVNGLSASSNHNSYYLGTPGPSRLFCPGVPNPTLLSGLQAFFNSDAQSFVENPPFISTVGSSTNYLDINPLIPTQIEGGGASISGITTDIVNTVRSNPPDVGAWEGNFTLADKTAPLIVNSGFAGPPCNGSSRTFTANLTDVSGVASGSLAPRLYYRLNFGLYTSTQGILTAGTATNGTWTFNLNYSATLGDVIWYFLALQDVSYLNNLQIVPATGAVLTDVNNVSVPPNPASNYTIQTFPTISVAATSATVCASHPYVIQASGASSYSYFPGTSAVVIPVSNTIYSVSGESSLGCPSTNTISVNITALPIPTITVNSGSICAGQSFTIMPNGASSYTYEGGSSVVSPPANSNYTVIGSLTQQGCPSLPAISTVSVFAANIGAVASTPEICIGGTVVLNGTGGISYTWNSPVVNNVPFAPLSTAVYTVTANSTNGCAGSKTIQVTVNPLPSISLIAFTNTVCTGETFTITAFGASNYTWQPNFNTSAVYTAILLSTTYISVEGVDSHDCGSTASITMVADLCLGIPDLKEETIRIFPNPTSGDFYVYNNNQANDLSIRVTDVSGRLVFQSALSLTQSRIDLAHYTDGIYLIEVSMKNAVISRSKIILARP